MKKANAELVGKYVLATKYSDGDPNDHWVVGFVSGITWHGRYDVVDAGGQLFRHNGFRRAEEISEEVGAWLVEKMKETPRGPVCSGSVWGLLKTAKRETASKASEGKP